MDLDSVADELYGLDPSEFTSARDARAAEAKKADPALSKSIKALRRPTASAWAVNLLARRARPDIERLLQIGEALREAQANLSAEQMRSLGRQRHQVVAGLARQSRRLAADAGHPLGDAAEREVEATLEAALSDPDAGQAVLAGRLTKGLEHAGLGGLEPVPAVRVDQRLEEAQAEVERARAAVQAAAEEMHRAQRHADDAAAAVTEIERRLDEARETAQRTEAEVEEARRRHAEASEAEEQALELLRRLSKGEPG